MMMMMMIIITIIVTIIIIAFKGAIRDFFYNLLTAPRTVSNTYTQVVWAQPCANNNNKKKMMMMMMKMKKKKTPALKGAISD